MAVCQIPAEGLAAFLAIALGRRAAETLEVRLSERSAGIWHRGVRAGDFPELQGVTGYAAQLLRSEEWHLFDGEAFAPARTWRLLPRAIEVVTVRSVCLVGMQTGTLYAVQPFDEPAVLTPAHLDGSGLDLTVTLHLDLTGAEVAL